MKLLLVEDHPEIAQELIRLLKSHRYLVYWCDSLTFAKEALLVDQFAVVLLDRGLPDGDGLELIKFANERLAADGVPPFVVLSAATENHDTVTGLTEGAVNYVGKPYDADVLLARLNVAHSLKAGVANKVLSLGNLEYDQRSKSVSLAGEQLQFPRRQAVIFDHLTRQFGKVVSHESLDRAVYGFEDEIGSAALRSQVSRLRGALTQAGATITIEVVRHIGYIMKEES